MAVYMILEIEVLDEETYAQYKERVPATLPKYGGRYLVRGGEVTPLSGNWHPERIVIVEFPSAEHFQSWLTSPEYSELAQIRLRSTKSKAVMVEGYSAPK
jgi:uncharacterized protein (DUF1330 family)